MVAACPDAARYGIISAGKGDMQATQPSCHLGSAGSQGALQAVPLSANWCREQPVGYGLSNLGLTCYLNSVLQCLAHTPPLANLCLASAHSRSCPLTGRCMACVLEAQIREMLGRAPGHQSCIRPSGVVSNLTGVSRQLRLGRQEDAHEFLRCLVDALERDMLRAVGLWDPKQRIKHPTTPANQLFSGILSSQVACGSCGAISSTYDPFQDLSLELGPRTSSVGAALAAFTQPEQLDGTNKYRCDSCKQLVAATKRLTIYDEPNVLVIHLKRFNHFHFEKIDRHIKFEETLSLAPFLCSIDSEEYSRQPAAAAAEAGGVRGPRHASSVHHQHQQEANGHLHHHHHHHNQQHSQHLPPHYQQQQKAAGQPQAHAAASCSASAPDRSTPAQYMLHGVVVHVGRTVNSGHYYAYVKDGLARSPQRWHRADDSLVTRSSWERVSGESAYLLFYVRNSMKPMAPLPAAAAPQAAGQPAAAAAPAAVAAAGSGPCLKHKRQGAFIGPMLPPGLAAASSSSSDDGETAAAADGAPAAKRVKLQPIGPQLPPSSPSPAAAHTSNGSLPAPGAGVTANGSHPAGTMRQQQQQVPRVHALAGVQLAAKAQVAGGSSSSSSATTTRIQGPRQWAQGRAAAIRRVSGGGLDQQQQQQQAVADVGEAAAIGPAPAQEQQQQQQAVPGSLGVGGSTSEGPPPLAGSSQELKQYLHQSLSSSSWRQRLTGKLQQLKAQGWSYDRVMLDEALRQESRRSLPQEVLRYAMESLSHMLGGTSSSGK